MDDIATLISFIDDDFVTSNDWGNMTFFSQFPATWKIKWPNGILRIKISTVEYKAHTGDIIREVAFPI